MPKRPGGRLSHHFRAKRSRGGSRRKFAPKNQFASQLGGWSSYPVRRSKPTLRTISTRPASSTGVLQGSDVKGQIQISMGASIPQNIRDVFQRIKIKKIEVFCIPAHSSTVASYSVQLSICRSLQDDDSINPLTVPGATVKFVQGGNSSTANIDGVSDYTRAARFYPPITFDGAEAITTKETYLDTSNADGSWKCFNWQMANINPAGGERPPTTLRFYSTITLLCDGQKA